MISNTELNSGDEPIVSAPQEIRAAATTVAPASTRRRPRRRVPEITYSALLLVALIVIWQIVVKVFNVSEIIVPAPTAVAESLVGGILDGSLVTQGIVTLKEVAFGFALAVVTALVSAVLITQFRPVERVLFPLLILTQTIPKVAMAPLLIVWFGIGLTSKTLTVALIAFFPLLINAILGFRSAPREQVEMLRSFGASRVQVMRYLQIPSALPHIFAGLEVAVIMSVTGAIVAEFVGSSEGLGYLIQASNFNLDVANTFAVIVILSAIGMLLHTIVVRLNKWLVFWSDSPTTAVSEA